MISCFEPACNQKIAGRIEDMKQIHKERRKSNEEIQIYFYGI